MVIKCKNCSGALTYIIDSKLMHCSYCDANYPIEEVWQSDASLLMMECNVYTCHDCGAELAINDAESACFCGYCGQPNVVFNRTTLIMRPGKILPFTVKREDAVLKMKEKYQKGFFVPKSFKKLKVERATPIYVPFRIYNINYNDKQKITLNYKNVHDEQYREAQVRFKGLTMDSALNLCNESSQKLEPYHLEALVDFKEPYLSGFYADCSDEPSVDIDIRALDRCKKLYNDAVTKSISLQSKVASSHPNYEIENRTTALLPAWFMSLEYHKRIYTILVNGQTGKVVGAVPYSKAKLWGVFLAIASVCALIFAYPMDLLFHYMDGKELSVWVLVVIGAILMFLFGGSMSVYDKHKKSMANTAAEEMEQYALKRQTDGNSGKKYGPDKKKKKNKISWVAIILIIIVILLGPYASGFGLSMLFYTEYLGIPVGILMAIGIGVFLTTTWMCKSNDVGSMAGTLEDFTTEPIKFYDYKIEVEK